MFIDRKHFFHPGSSKIEFRMADKGMESEILKYLRLLEGPQQNRVLSYIKSLMSPKKTEPQAEKKAILKWAGSIDLSSLHEMESAIDNAFNKVDLNEW